MVICEKAALKENNTAIKNTWRIDVGLRINIQRKQEPGLTSPSDLKAKMFHQLAEHFSIMGGLVLFAFYKFTQFFFAAGEREHIIHLKVILFIGGVFVGMFGKNQLTLFKAEEVADLHYLFAGKTIL